MAKIYIPLEEGENYACFEVRDKDTIRAYISTPSYNSTSNYTDFFINSHYLRKTGSVTWSNYSTLPVCVNNQITQDFYYRNDISDILISFIIIALVCIYMPFKLFSRIFGRWLKI